MDFDGALINALHDNGRLPVSELARRLGVPRRRVQERMHELLDSGAIRIAANVHPSLLGIHVYCDLQIWVDGASAPVLEALRGVQEASFISAVAGNCDLVVEIGAEDRSHLEVVLARIRSIPGVRETVSSQLVQIFKSRFEDTTDLDVTPARDDIDARIIALLREDGRTSYRVLGHDVGLSIGAVRARLARLMQNGMLRIACEVKGQDAARRIQLGAGIRLCGESMHLIDTLRSMPAVTFAALAVGHFDVIVTASGPTLRALHSAVDEIRALECVNHVTSWMHLDVLRESYE